MKKKIYLFIAVMSISATFFTGCGDKETDTRETVKETTTEEYKSEKDKALEEDLKALDSIKDAINEYISDEEADIYKEHLEQSLQGQLSDEMIKELQDILGGSEEIND